MSGTGSNYKGPNFVIPYIAPDNVPKADLPWVQPIYTAFQNLIQTLITYAGIAPRNPSAILSSNNDPTAILSGNGHRFYSIALEAIPQGAAVNLFGSSGTLFLRNAVATDLAHQADGFCSQDGGIPAGGVGEVILSDGVILTGVAGLLPGARYFLSSSAPGSYTITAPTTAGQIRQPIGIAITANSLRFWAGTPTQL